MSVQRGILHILGRRLRRPYARRLFLLLAAVVLLVQTGFPAHEDSHPLGSLDTHCQYCVLGGHLFSLPMAAVEPPAPPARAEAPPPAPVAIHIPAFPRTHFSRGPPAGINA